MTIILTGGAGFIASNLIADLLESDSVISIDNLSLGSPDNLSKFLGNENFSLQIHDLADTEGTIELFDRIQSQTNVTEVWHFAANSDIPSGVKSPKVDLDNTFMSTHNVLLAMKHIDVKKLYFASSSAIYGDMGGEPVNENSGPLLPISNYGAMKLASEAAISAAAESFLDVAAIFRFPNVVGTPATHGVILDFVRKLQKSPRKLDVLGDGTQKKSYFHVSDLVRAMLHIRDQKPRGVELFNIGPSDDGVEVRQIAENVVACMSPQATICYGKSNKGWVGDVPKFSYSTDKLQSLGWIPRLSSNEAINRAINEIYEQEKEK